MLQNILTAMTRFHIVLRGGSSKLWLPKQGDHASKHDSYARSITIMARDEAFNNNSKLVLDSHDQISHSIQRGSSKLWLPKQGDHASKHFDSYPNPNYGYQNKVTMLQNILTAMTRFHIVLRGGSSKLWLEMRRSTT